MRPTHDSLSKGPSSSSRAIPVAIAGLLVLGIITSPARAAEADQNSPRIDAYGAEALGVGEVKDAAWHPAGNRIVFFRHVDDDPTSDLRMAWGGAVYERDVVTGAERVLINARPERGLLGLPVGGTFTSYTFERPVYSPDGRLLAYTESAERLRFESGTFDRGAPQVYASRGNIASLGRVESVSKKTYILDLDSGRRWNLTSILGFSHSQDFAWSGDGTGLVRGCSLQRARSSNRQRYLQCTPMKVRFSLENGTGTSTKTSEYIAVSPNGRFAAFQSRPLTRPVIRDLRTGARMGSGPQPCLQCISAISDDGTSFWTFASSRGTLGRLTRFETSTGARIATTTVTRPIALAPDGQRLLVMGSDNDLSIAAVDRPSLKPLVACPRTREADPATYDACWAGFQSPEARAVSVVKCQIYETSRSNTGKAVLLTVRFELVGGSFRGSSFTEVQRVPPWELYENPYPIQDNLRVTFYPAVGYSGQRTLELPWSIDLDPQTMCS